MIDCPNHEGAYDCTPFCPTCHGEQEIEEDQVEWKPNQVMTYRYMSDYATIEFPVLGKSEWTDEEWDSASQFDLESYVSDPEDYNLDDCWIENTKGDK